MTVVTAFVHKYITTSQLQWRVRYDARCWLPDLVQENQWYDFHKSAKAHSDDDKNCHQADICFQFFMSVAHACSPQSAGSEAGIGDIFLLLRVFHVFQAMKNMPLKNNKPPSNLTI